MSDTTQLSKIATIATMPSRVETFKKMLPGIYAQVDWIFIYLDGYDSVPDFLRGVERVTVGRAEEMGNLHASSRFLCLRELKRPSLVFCVDDDILYPADYVARLCATLSQVEYGALVGVHGRIFFPPHCSYVRDAMMLQFANVLDKPCHVHEVGMGTSAFLSSRLPVDPTSWNSPGMDDMMMALEAQRRGLARIAVARPSRWLRPLAAMQPDSISLRTLKDDSEQSRQMRRLLGLYV